MASISTGGSDGKRKSVDTPLALVPFIDLLLCCVMFLLVTAVWNQLAAFNVSQHAPGSTMDVPKVPTGIMRLAVHANGYELSTTSGDRQRFTATEGEQVQLALAALRSLDSHGSLTVSGDDGVEYGKLIRAIDLARSAGFDKVDVADALEP